MPAKSGKQYRMFQSIAHGSSNRKGGPSPEVAREFIEKTSSKKRREFSRKRK